LFSLCLLFFFLYLAFILFRPYCGTIVFAVALISVCHPAHQRILQRCKGRKNLAALVSTTLLVLVIIIPLLSFTAALIDQGAVSLGQVNAWVKAGNLEKAIASEKLQPVRTLVDRLLTRFKIRELNLQKMLAESSAKLGKFVLSRGTELLGNATRLLVSFLLLILMVFYFFRDGQLMVERLQHLLPLSKENEERLTERVRVLSNTVVLANVATAAAQGVVGGIGLWIAGIPALFWGSMMAFTSLIPAVGTALVWVPAVAYLLITGHKGKALFLAIWCVVLVGSIDNFLRPFLMKGEGGTSSFYLFFAILGGMQAFGLMGIIYGPLILGMCSIVIYQYELEYKDLLTNE
jgi:predicted PurR-regulated permease PerM